MGRAKMGRAKMGREEETKRGGDEDEDEGQ